MSRATGPRPADIECIGYGAAAGRHPASVGSVTAADPKKSSFSKYSAGPHGNHPQF